jgi:hypothetical protein
LRAGCAVGSRAGRVVGSWAGRVVGSRASGGRRRVAVEPDRPGREPLDTPCVGQRANQGTRTGNQSRGSLQDTGREYAFAGKAEDLAGQPNQRLSPAGIRLARRIHRELRGLHTRVHPPEYEQLGGSPRIGRVQAICGRHMQHETRLGPRQRRRVDEHGQYAADAGYRALGTGPPDEPLRSESGEPLWTGTRVGVAQPRRVLPDLGSEPVHRGEGE